MEYLESFVLSHPYLAVYAFFCADFIAMLMIAQKSRALIFMALTLAIVGSGLVPAGDLYY